MLDKPLSTTSPRRRSAGSHHELQAASTAIDLPGVIGAFDGVQDDPVGLQQPGLRQLAAIATRRADADALTGSTPMADAVVIARDVNLDVRAL